MSSDLTGLLLPRRGIKANASASANPRVRFNWKKELLLEFLAAGSLDGSACATTVCAIGLVEMPGASWIGILHTRPVLSARESRCL